MIGALVVTMIFGAVIYAFTGSMAIAGLTGLVGYWGYRSGRR